MSRRIADRFELETLAGRGGMGEVWRATDLASGEPVAVKVLALLGKLALTRFHHESALLAGAAHPAIVRYLAHGVDEEGPWIAMEWVHGEGLGARLERGPLPVADAIALVTRIAEGLATLHDAGVVHRDLKPDNVLLPHGAPREAKLVDFGVARVPGPRATRPGMVVGTPGYIAPEQVRGEDVDARADVFALGTLLYECVTGEPAFSGEHPLAIFTKTLLDDPIPMRSLAPHAPEELEALVGALLAKDTGARMPDAGSVASALRALAGGDRTEIQIVLPRVGEGERRMTSLLVGQRRGVGHGADTLDDAVVEHERGRIVAVAERFGAHVEVVTGASFAVTVPRGSVGTDAPRRAVRCALALAGALSDHAMAVATVRTGTSDPRSLGETIERAAERLSPHEHAGGVAVDEVTASLLDGRFRIARDAAGPVVLEERSGPPLPRSSGTVSCFVGRERELAMLEGVLAECASACAPRVALVLGEPGSGKSRLALELTRLVEVHAPRIVWACADSARGHAPLALAAEILAPLVSARSSQQPGTSAWPPALDASLSPERMHAAIVATVPESERELALAFLPDALGLGAALERPSRRAAASDPALLASQIRRAAVSFLGALAQERPLLIVIDDAHHADEPTLRMLDELLRETTGAMLVLGLATPELDERFPALFSRRSVLRFALPPLGIAAAERIVRGAMGEDAGESDVRAVIEHAEGSPFALEELSRERESHGERNESVLSIVESRIARLEPGVRRVLRAASVLGERFEADAVRALLGRREGDAETARALVEAVEAELVVPEERSGVHRFRNRLLREAAYAMLTDDDRTVGHRLAAEWIELTREGPAAEIAAHYAGAGVGARAAEWYARAASEAVAGDDLRAALACAERGLELSLTQASTSLHATRAHALAWLGRTAEALAAAEQALIDAEKEKQEGSRDWLLAASVAAVTAGGTGRVERLVEIGEALLELANAHDEGALALALTRTTNQLFFNGRYPLAERTLARLEDVAAGLDEPVARARLAQVRGIAASHRGDHAALIEAMRTAATLFERAGDQRALCVCRANLGAALDGVGLFDEAERVCRDALALIERLELTSVSVPVRLNLAQALLGRGRAADAAAVALEAMRETQGAGDVRLEGVAGIASARAHLALGALDDAANAVEHAVLVLDGVPAYRALALAVRSSIAGRRGDTVRALDDAHDAMRVLSELGALEDGEGLVRLALVEALLAAGHPVEAESALDAAARRIEEHASALPAPLAAAVRAIPEHARLLALRGA